MGPSVRSAFVGVSIPELTQGCLVRTETAKFWERSVFLSVGCQVAGLGMFLENQLVV